jgi:hypothetical protein
MGEGAAPQTSGTSPGGGSEGGGSTPGGTAGSEGAMGGSAGDTNGGGNGGSAGSSGSGGSAGTAPVGDPDAIDDMEDNDAQIVTVPGRNGYWYVGNDGTAAGKQEPTVGIFKMTELAADARPGSLYSARMKASGFTGWGTVLGFNFFEQLGKVKAFDASDYCGVTYWGKAAAATNLRFRITSGDTHPEGMVCTDGGAAGEACYDHFGANASFTTAWQEFTVMFAAVDQVGTGYHPEDGKLKADQLFGLEWALPGAAGKAYEIWVDDVAFLKCQ